MKLTIGTRGSALALWQANHISARLRELDATAQVELRIIKTKGDKILDVPLAKVGGKGLFVKEIEDALMRREIDLAVHSMKDVPSELVEGAILGAVPPREDPRDVLVSAAGPLSALPPGSLVGTSSLRRRTQLMERRSDLQIENLRGNVDTRLRKLDEGQYRAIILAAAGLKRLGHEARVTEYLAADSWVPAVGQGALGIETRADDDAVLGLVAQLHHDSTAVCVEAERAFLRRLGGGCQVPIAAHATLDGDALSLEGLVGHPSGAPVLRATTAGGRASATELGTELAEQLLSRGADKILAEVYE